MAKVTIYEDKCKGCKLCTSVCPKRILEIDETKINLGGFHPVCVVDEADCIGCGFCTMICPDTAIRIGR